MKDGDALENNPRVTRSALESIHESLFGWALSRCDHDPAVAEDLMQQAYVELLSGRARFDGRSSLKTFVFGVVQNLARSRFRRKTRHMALVAEHASEPQPAFEPPTESTSIWQVVTGLPPRQRDIVELVFLRELTIEQASRVMGVSVGTGRVHYDRAKKALRAALGDRDSGIDTAFGAQ